MKENDAQSFFFVVVVFNQRRRKARFEQGVDTFQEGKTGFDAS